MDRWNYDAPCANLAEHFLAERRHVTQFDLHRLAQALHDRATEWIEDEAHDRDDAAGEAAWSRERDKDMEA